MGDKGATGDGTTTTTWQRRWRAAQRRDADNDGGLGRRLLLRVALPAGVHSGNGDLDGQMNSYVDMNSYEGNMEENGDLYGHMNSYVDMNSYQENCCLLRGATTSTDDGNPGGVIPDHYNGATRDDDGQRRRWRWRDRRQRHEAKVKGGRWRSLGAVAEEG